MARSLAHRSVGACVFLFFFFFFIHSFSSFPQGPADVQLRFGQSFCAESVRVISCCAVRAQHKEPACDVWKRKKKKKKEGERKRGEKETSVAVVAVAFFLKGQWHQITGLPPLEGGAATTWNLADPFLLLLLLLLLHHHLFFFCYYHLFSFWERKKAEWSTHLFQLYRPAYLIAWPTSFLCKPRGLKPSRILFSSTQKIQRARIKIDPQNILLRGRPVHLCASSWNLFSFSAKREGRKHPRHGSWQLEFKAAALLDGLWGEF